MNGLIRKLVKAVGVKWLTGQVRAAAEGALGPKWMAAYWWMAGRKRTISTFIAVGAGVAVIAGYPTWAEVLAGVAAVGMSLGFVDANWRDDAEADWLKDSALWRLAAHNAPIITAGLVAATGWLQGSTCSLGEWCARGTIFVTIAGAVFVQIGIVDAAWKSPAPLSETSPPPQP